MKNILFILFILFIGLTPFVVKSQNAVKIHSFSMTKTPSFNSELSLLLKSIENDFIDCGESLSIDENETFSYKKNMKKYNKYLKTKLFSKITYINRIGIYPKVENSACIFIEEFSFVNEELAKKAFVKLQLFNKISMRSIYPINRIYFQKRNKIILLSSKDYHVDNSEMLKVNNIIVTSVFQGKEPKIIKVSQ